MRAVNELLESAEELAADYSLPLPAILGAIEYGKSDPPEILADIAREEAIMRF